MKILITRLLPPIAEEQLRAAGHEVHHRKEDSPISRGDLLTMLAGMDAAIFTLGEKVDAELLSIHTSVRIAANFAVGYNNIDVSAATKRGVVVTNTPDVLTDATADMAFALILAAARRMGEGERLVRAHKWDGWGPLQLLGIHVTGKTLGIIGPGRIGRAVARRARGFEMPVIYWGRSGNSQIEHESGARRVELDELLSTADVISIHTPLNAQTRHLIGARELALMRQNSVIVNTARGPVIDEAALVEALRKGRPAVAGLDVFEEEPKLHPGLYELDNAVLIPHLGSATYETRSAMARICAENIIAFFEGRRPPQIVNPEVLGASR